MQTSNAPRNRLRGALMALVALLFLGALPLARADDVQDAQKLLKAGQPQQALERVNRALASNPRDPQARFLKGLILTEQGKQQDAIEIFTKLTQDYPNLPEPYNNLAVLYAGQGQFEKARATLEAAIHTNPRYRSGSACLNSFPRFISGVRADRGGAELSTAAGVACDERPTRWATRGAPRIHAMQPLGVLAMCSSRLVCGVRP